jgi:hypothetical protein
MAAKGNLVIDQGADFEAKIQMTDDNGDLLYIGDYTANSHIKKWYTSTTVTAEFNATVNVSTSEITLQLYSNQTSLIPEGRYVYDVLLTNSTTNAVSRFIEGIITVTPRVTT